MLIHQRITQVQLICSKHGQSASSFGYMMFSWLLSIKLHGWLLILLDQQSFAFVEMLYGLWLSRGRTSHVIVLRVPFHQTLVITVTHYVLLSTMCSDHNHLMESHCHSRALSLATGTVTSQLESYNCGENTQLVMLGTLGTDVLIRCHCVISHNFDSQLSQLLQVVNA